MIGSFNDKLRNAELDSAQFGVTTSIGSFNFQLPNTELDSAQCGVVTSGELLIG